MKLSITSWSFPACTLSEAWGVARALGFGAIDIGLLHGAALDGDLIRRDPQGAASALAPLGLRVANLYWLFGPDPHMNAMSDAAALSRNVAEFSRVLTFARQVGATSIFLLPGMSRAGVAQAALTAASAAAFRAMLPLAQEAGIVLTVEPHVGGILTSPAETLAFLEAVPGLKLTLDHAHFVAMGHPQEAVDALLPHAGHVHLRQARPGALQAKWGEGTIDFARIFNGLGALGYAGHLAVEYVHQNYMNTLFDDVLTETVRMRDLAWSHGIR